MSLTSEDIITINDYITANIDASDFPVKPALPVYTKVVAGTVQRVCNQLKKQGGTRAVWDFIFYEKQNYNRNHSPEQIQAIIDAYYARINALLAEE